MIFARLEPYAGKLARTVLRRGKAGNSFLLSDQVKNIDGDVTSKGHEKWILLDSFDLGIARNVITKVGNVQDREHGIPKISDFIITKNLDKASPYLFEQSLVGTSLGDVKIDACGASDGSDKYLQYTFSDVIVSHYDINGISSEDSNDKPVETLRLNFTKVEMKYIPRNSKNEPLSPVSTGYDIEKASKI
jgi:type VI secretion system secreted protein Hcp